MTHLPSDRNVSLGAEAVDLAAMAGLELDDWQAWCLEQSLMRDSRRRWSAFEVAILVARQNGKGSILEARQLAGLFLLHERLQVHTAHEFKTCFEHFQRVVNLIEGCDDLSVQVARIRRGAGEQAIELKTGERLRFLARSSGSGRGMSGDVVYLDEAFALTPPIMGALLPTLSARPDPQVWYTSSAPMSTSLVLHDVLQRGIDGVSGRLFLANWGHELGVDPEDREKWYEANPALGIRIAEEMIEAELDAMRSMPEEFARERLGVPDPPASDVAAPKLVEAKWLATATESGPPKGRVVFGFDVDLDAGSASITVAAGTAGAPYMENIEHKQGVGWLPARLVELVQRRDPLFVAYNAAGPALEQIGAVQVAFREAGLSTDVLMPVNAAEYRAACGSLYSRVAEGTLRRPRVDQGPLDRAALDASERPLAEGWVWHRRQATVPISPLVAGTVACHLLPIENVVIDAAMNVW